MTRLTAEALFAAASRGPGAPDFGDALYLPPLSALLRAIVDEAELGPERTTALREDLVALLRGRARIHALWRAHPEIQTLPLEAPIFVVGMPRTGTTLLHNLLAAHPAHRCPRLWELRFPVLPAGPKQAAEAMASAQTARFLEALYNTVPDLRVIHPMSANTPDECSWLFRNDFATMVYAFTYHVPSYINWLLATDMAPYYEHYRRTLQILLWQRPGGRLVLKDPCHLWHIDAILRVFPGAKIIHLHRSMTEALPSMASLCFAFHKSGSGRTDPHTMASYCSTMVERGFEREQRARAAAPPGTLIDLSYTELVGDPIGSARRICEAVGSSVEPTALVGMEAWLRENRQHKAGRHNYTLEQFGFDREVISRQFGRYEEVFERVR